MPSRRKTGKAVWNFSLSNAFGSGLKYILESTYCLHISAQSVRNLYDARYLVMVFKALIVSKWYRCKAQPYLADSESIVRLVQLILTCEAFKVNLSRLFFRKRNLHKMHKPIRCNESLDTKTTYEYHCCVSSERHICVYCVVHNKLNLCRCSKTISRYLFGCECNVTCRIVMS